MHGALGTRLDQRETAAQSARLVVFADAVRYARRPIRLALFGWLLGGAKRSAAGAGFSRPPGGQAKRAVPQARRCQPMETTGLNAQHDRYHPAHGRVTLWRYRSQKMQSSFTQAFLTICTSASSAHAPRTIALHLRVVLQEEAHIL